MESLNIARNDTYILIPAYKPDHLLIELLVKLKSEDFDVVVVNDGSGEPYNEVFEEVKKYALLLEHSVNRGKGAALRFGFSYINLHPNGHNYVITCDADGQHAMSDIIKMNEKLHETNAIVFGCRKFGKNVPFKSKVGNNMSRFSRTLLTKEYIQDDQSGLRGFPIKFVEHLIPLEGDHYEYEMNVVCTLQIKKIKIIEMPIETIYINDNKGSHFKPNLDTFRIQRTIWTNVLIPLICGLISIGIFSLFSWLFPKFPPYALLAICYLFYYQLTMGVLALVWPTKKMPRRVLIEGGYATVKTGIVFGLFALFSWLLPDGFNPLAYFIAILLCFFCNFPLAYFVWMIKNKKNYKE